MLSLEYVAGFIDGEGGFGIYPDQVRMTVSNTNRDVLEQIAATIGGGRLVERPPKKETHKTCYELQVGSKLLREFLPRLIPHLIVKRTQAELVVEYLAPIPICKAGMYYEPSMNEIGRRARIRIQMRGLNAHGSAV